MRRAKIFEQRKVRSGAIQRRARKKPNNFGPGNLNSLARSFTRDRVECPSDGGLFVIREVHRDLDHAAALQFETKRLYERQAAVALAHGTRNSPGDG